MREMPKAFELYKHFKGNLYQVMAIATDSEDGSQKVVYQALYGDYKIYVRDLQSFMSLTDKEKYPNAEQKYRFELVTDRNRVEATESVLENDPMQEAVKKADYDAESMDMNPTDLKMTKTAEKEEQSETAQEEMVHLDPAVSAYLDAVGYEERLNILTSVHHRLTDEMIDTMSIASDIELEEGSIEDKYQSLKNCLLTKQKFEILKRG